MKALSGFFDNVRLAFGTLWVNPLRSMLTLLGVVIATTTLIVVMSVVNGMNLYIATKIANLGTNTFVLSKFKWAQGYEAYLAALRHNRPIRIEEYDYLCGALTGYEAMPLERLTMLVVPLDSPAVLVVPELEAPRVQEEPEVFGIGGGIGDGHLMRTERALDLFAIDELRAGPSLG